MIKPATSYDKANSYRMQLDAEARSNNQTTSVSGMGAGLTTSHAPSYSQHNTGSIADYQQSRYQENTE